MRIVCIIMVLMTGILWGVSGEARQLTRDVVQIQEEARQGFDQILDLWHEGRFDDVYHRIQPGGSLTLEAFRKRLADVDRPACCWEKLQDVSVSVQGDDRVILKGRITFDTEGESKYRTKRVKLVREGELWRISQSEFLSLAGTGKPKAHRKSAHYRKAN